MQTAYFPASAAEFPNDNPVLHHGARWVCRHTQGWARALLRAPRPELSSVTSAATLGDEPAPPSAAELPRPAPTESDAALLRQRLAGPLQLDLQRIVLPHRVENVPPPPEFIYQPFVSSRARELRLALETLCAPPLQPLGYRIVDQQLASRRVQRSWRVDLAPCLSIREPALPLESAPLPSGVADSAVAESMVSPLAESLLAPLAVAPAAPSETLAAALEPLSPEPVPVEPVRPKRARKARRGAVVPAVRALSPAPVPCDGELERAIAAVEVALAERPWGGKERRRSPRVASCTSLSSAVLSALSAGGI